MKMVKRGRYKREEVKRFLDKAKKVVGSRKRQPSLMQLNAALQRLVFFVSPATETWLPSSHIAWLISSAPCDIYKVRSRGSVWFV